MNKFILLIRKLSALKIQKVKIFEHLITYVSYKFSDFIPLWYDVNLCTWMLDVMQPQRCNIIFFYICQCWMDVCLHLSCLLCLLGVLKPHRLHSLTPLPNCWGGSAVRTLSASSLKVGVENILLGWWDLVLKVGVSFYGWEMTLLMPGRNFFLQFYEIPIVKSFIIILEIRVFHFRCQTRRTCLFNCSSSY